ncbi:hypothetical protein J437_LFUL011658 [Ladona fulva]|uniref:Uncharacterized protein n=1 Tax=Ladona fulva TaxID=123851 RepID=A0A8K0P1C1_LADFU|nr:hypothetical protein J437_LFUL011658 [Ladona fulva]
MIFTIYGLNFKMRFMWLIISTMLHGISMPTLRIQGGKILDNLDSAFLEKMIGEGPDNRQGTLVGKESLKLDEIVCSFIDEENSQNFKDLPLELSGFCIWCLVQGDGALIPGNPKLGL